MVSPEHIVKGAVWGARFLRWMKVPGAVGAIRRRASFEFARTIHMQLGRSLRVMPRGFWGDKASQRLVAERLNDFCSAARLLMCQLIERNANQVHCCIKVFVKGPSEDADSVETFARSEPNDGRPITDDFAHRVARNSMLSAIMGKNDGIHSWRPYNCFACNDLAKHADEFQCERPKWRRYYTSLLAFPLRYHSEHDPGTFDTFGFLVFDSAKPDAFVGLPDIFEHKTKWDVYHDSLNESTVFHFGAIAADYISVALRPHYQAQPAQITNATSSNKSGLLE